MADPIINPDTDPEVEYYQELQRQNEISAETNDLAEPPNPDQDEFAGLDTAIAQQENGLAEPPVLSDDEVDAYLGGIQPEALPELGPDGAQLAQISAKGILAPLQNTRAQGTGQDISNYNQLGDWRVRLQLAPGGKYLYKSDNPGILFPLKESDGVIFPYTPAVTVAYSANYDGQDLTHSNYKIYQYRSSSVDNISITCTFTAQDTFEANYLLAVIHFFRSATKMFYGQDQNPKPGVPPPLCYLTGLGSFQFDQHPLAITGFTYTLPDNVDYIRAGSTANTAGTNLSAYNQRSNANNISAARLGARIQPGALSAPPNFQKLSNKEPTYVPTKIQLQISCIPIVSRNDVSNNFSLKSYSSGQLLKGRTNPGGGGFW